jgi:hypothetical protein
MKHCPTCKKKYDDASLNFCLEDGSTLTFFDTEAETLKSAPRKPEMSADDIKMEMANILRSVGGAETLIRFELHTGIGATTEQISENFNAAAEEAGYDVISRTNTRATVRRKPAKITFREAPFPID